MSECEHCGDTGFVRVHGPEDTFECFESEECEHCDAGLLEAQYEGLWTRLLCPHCDAYWYIEGDVNREERVTCDECGADSKVEGR